MPDRFSEGYQKMLAELPIVTFTDGEDILNKAQSAILNIRRSMELLRTYCENHIFINEAAEISFFKAVKPKFHAQLILWMSIYEIELMRPVGGKKYQIKFLKKRLSLLQEFFIRHKDFYQYYRSGQTDRDTLYFIRNTHDSHRIVDPNIVNLNTRFTSPSDYLVAAILGNTLVEKYLKTTLARLKLESSPSANKPLPSTLHWTASKTGLVELIYFLQCGGVFNNGKAQVQEIADEFQKRFNIKLINYYHMFNELRSRKKNRTAFLQSLLDKLTSKMDDLEGS